MYGDSALNCGESLRVSCTVTVICHRITRSSFIQRVCYDKAQSYMPTNIRVTFYHYHDSRDLRGAMAAPSMASFYSQSVKRTGKDSPCRTHRLPR